MLLRSSLWISAVALGGLILPASAETDVALPAAPTPATITRTFLFPATGLAQTESARIDVVNIAPAAPNGTPASCSGTIAFTNDTGATVGTAVQFTSLGAHQIAHGDLLGFTPSDMNTKRHEYQGSVQITYSQKAWAPCSLLLTLTVFDTTTGETKGVVTAAIDAPVPMPLFGR